MDLDDLRTLMKMKRERRGWSQFDLAQRVGVTQAYIARIEAGTADDVSYKKMQGILKALDQDGDEPGVEARRRRQQQVKDALETEGYTLRDLARELGVHDSTVGSVVAGRGKSQRVRDRILEITGIAI